MRLLPLLLAACAASPELAAPRELPHGDPAAAAVSGPATAPLPPPLPSTCTSADLVGLSPSELVDWLEANDDGCLYFLWTLDAQVSATLSSDAHIEAVLASIAADAAAWMGPDPAQLREKLLLVRIRYYHGFYSPAPFAGSDILPETLVALDALSANPHLLDPLDDAEDVLYEWVNVVDGSEQAGRYVRRFEDLLRAWTGARVGDYGAQLAVYGAAVTMGRHVGNGYAGFLSAADAALLDALGDAVDAGLAGGAPAWVTNNLIWSFGRFADVPAVAAAAVSRLTAWYQTLPAYTEPWLWVVASLDDFNDCLTSVPGLTVCRSDVAPQVEAFVFPRAFSFDDGALVIHTSLAEPEVRRLYHAIHAVHASADRLLRGVAPLPGDPNGVLTLRIYDSPESYAAYQSFLYGLSSNNGGIYIEQDGTLYTYDRTPAQSIFTLEELVRHEMAHAVLGRWAVDGMWGEVPIYEASRMVFFDEGLAEMLAGATPTSGVVPRAVLVDQVVADGAARMHVPEIVRATYGNFEFYPYAGLLMTWLHRHDPGRLLALLDAARAGDVAAFDAWVAAAAADAALDAAFQGWLDDLAAGVERSLDPVTPAFPAAAFAPRDAAAVTSLFAGLPNGAGARCVISETSSLGRFSCRGVWTTRAASDLVGGWQVFQGKADALVASVERATRGPSPTLWGTVCRTGGLTLLGATPATEWYCTGTLAAPALPAQTDLQRHTADVTAAGFGAPSCSAPGGAPTCELTLRSAVFPTGTPEATLTADLALRAGVVDDRVYARGRGFHRAGSCLLTGAHTVQRTPAGLEATQRVRCALSVQ